MNEHEEDFKQILADADIPIDEATLAARFQEDVNNSEFGISNDSAYSPFWRAVQSLITLPTLFLIDALINAVLPNFYIKTASSTFLDMLAWALDVTRKSPTSTTGVIAFTRVDSVGALEVPAETFVQTSEINGLRYRVKTESVATFNDGELTINIPVVAEYPGQSYNLAAGYFNDLPEPISGVSVINLAGWITEIGSDEESDDDLRLRCRNQFSALNQYHSNAVYTALVTTFDGVDVDNVFYDDDAPRGPGTANIYILLDSGQPAAQLLTDIQNFIMDEGNHGHGDDLQLFAMPGIDIDLVMQLWFTPNLSLEQSTQLTADIENFVRCAFRENNDFDATKTLPFSTFSFSVLDKELHNNFTGLASVHFDLTDITSVLSVPRLSGLTVELP